MIKKLLAILALSSVVACTSTDNTDSAPGKSNTKGVSTIAMPLLTQVDSNGDGVLENWRVQGDVTIQRIDVAAPVINVAGFSASLATHLTVDVDPGTYNVHIANWTLTNQDGVDFCTDATADDICALIADTIQVNVASGETIGVVFEFLLAGTPAGITIPDDAGVPACGNCYCPAGNCCGADNDHDGFSNCVECPRDVFLTNPANCTDTNGNGIPDYLDPNSDCDNILDCNEGTTIGATFVLSNVLRIDDLTSGVCDTGHIDVDVNITQLDGSLPQSDGGDAGVSLGG